MSKPVYLHMCFICAREKDNVLYGEKPFVQIPVANEAEFKAWLGQTLCTMWDLYKLAATTPEVGDTEQIDLAMLHALSNPLLIELRTWVANQKRAAEDKDLIVTLGKDYAELVDTLNEHNITFMQGVELRISDDPEFGDRTRMAEVKHEG